jgi:hypothetical protein
MTIKFKILSFDKLAMGYEYLLVNDETVSIVTKSNEIFYFRHIGVLRHCYSIA